MKKKLTFTIDCGAKTCASVPGKFCHFIELKINGKNSCYIFGRLDDKDGWIQRHDECLKNGKNNY